MIRKRVGEEPDLTARQILREFLRRVPIQGVSVASSERGLDLRIARLV